VALFDDFFRLLNWFILQSWRWETCSSEMSVAFNGLHGFYFGVLHLVVRIVSRLIEETTFATIFQGVVILFYIYIICRYMLRPLLAIFRRKCSRKLPQLQRIHWFLLGPIYCICCRSLFKMLCRLFECSQIISILNIVSIWVLRGRRFSACDFSEFTVCFLISAISL
jgi:hypothetical protein